MEGNRLKGELIPQGAKNEALQVLCVPLLTSEKVTISNLPKYSRCLIGYWIYCED